MIYYIIPIVVKCMDELDQIVLKPIQVTNCFWIKVH